jgi:hypothetical protein
MLAPTYARYAELSCHQGISYTACVRGCILLRGAASTPKSVCPEAIRSRKASPTASPSLSTLSLPNSENTEALLMLRSIACSWRVPPAPPALTIFRSPPCLAATAEMPYRDP